MSSGRNKYRDNRRNHGNQTLSTVARENVASLAPDSPVLAIFKAAALKLNDRQDRHERLVKLSRDVTIESKRIIFLLHSAVRKEDFEKTITEANERLNKLISGPIKAIGLELENSPAYLHARAVSPGFQEFVEARTLCYLMQHKVLCPWTEVQNEFEYNIKLPELESEKDIVTLLPQTDYVLGLADLTGELMRRAINSIASGDSEECFHSCQVVRDLFTGFIGLYNTNREFSRKLSTTRANVAKVESAVYALKVRGGEAPPTLLIPAPGDWEQRPGDVEQDVDEGYY